MVYWLFLPLVFAVGLLVHVYVIDPHERSNRLFSLLALCVALSAAAALIVSTTPGAAVARWASLSRALTSFVLLGVVLWLLSLELVWGPAPRPGWVKGYTALVVVLAAFAGIAILSDHFGTRTIFYSADDRWHVELEFLRAVPAWGALGVLVWRFFRADAQWRVSLSPALLVVLAMPFIRPVVQGAVRRSFPGIDLLAEFLLVLALGYAANRRLFTPLDIAMHKLIDSMTDGVVVLNVDRQVLRISDVAAQLLAAPRQSSLHQPGEQLFIPWRNQGGDTASLDSLVQKIQAEPETRYDREIEIGRGETYRRVRIRVNPIYHDRGWLLGQMILLTDVTEMRNRQRRLERALAEQSKLAAAMAELSSPVLPVMPHTIVMPVVGNVDVKRSGLIANVLLEGVKTHRVQVAIIDLTGVQYISPDAALVLAESLDAARLLGAEPVLVGIRPGVAETLSDLELDIGALMVQADLQAGIQYATRALSARRT